VALTLRLPVDQPQLTLLLSPCRALKPGGWYEQHEPSLFFYSDHVVLPDDHPYPQWGQQMIDAGTKAGMRFDIGDKMKGWMEEAGFVDVTEYRMPWLVGGWSKDEHQRQVGQWNQLRLDLGIADFSARRLSNQMDVRLSLLRSCVCCGMAR